MLGGELNLFEKVKKVIDEQIRPALEAEGGFIELVEVKEDGKVLVRMGGACAACPMSQFTLKNFIEALLKEQVPGVKEVIPVL
jgi:Fe-S cluster biogenesis protein NfuA